MVKILQFVQQKNSSLPLLGLRFWKTKMAGPIRVVLKTENGKEITGIIRKDIFYPSQWCLNPNIEEIKQKLNDFWHPK